MEESRIPQLADTSKKATFTWLTELHKRELLFCLDDDPREIVNISDGLPAFTDTECTEISDILNRLFLKRGDEVFELAFEVFSRKFHTSAERRAFKTMYG